MTKLAAQSNKKSKRWLALYARCNGAMHRCSSLENEYYGGRGIECRFSSPKEMAEWVRDNLGYPLPGQSLDRVENSGHYERGNLRWATATEQGSNKRPYKVSDYGARVKSMQEARPDYSTTAIRKFIHDGMTDAEIKAKKKGAHSGTGIRYSRLQPQGS